MRSYKSPEQFFDEMKKKPELRNILDKLSDYSEKDIENTNQPKWIREILSKKLDKIYNEQNYYYNDNLMEITNKRKNDVNYQLNELKCPVYKFVSNTCLEVKPNRSRINMFVERDDIYFVVNDYYNNIEVKFGHILIVIDNEQFNKLLGKSYKIGDMSLNEYRDYYNNYIEQKYKNKL